MTPFGSFNETWLKVLQEFQSGFSCQWVFTLPISAVYVHFVHISWQSRISAMRVYIAHFCNACLHCPFLQCVFQLPITAVRVHVDNVSWQCVFTLPISQKLFTQHFESFIHSNLFQWFRLPGTPFICPSRFDYIQWKIAVAHPLN